MPNLVRWFLDFCIFWVPFIGTPYIAVRYRHQIMAAPAKIKTWWRSLRDPGEPELDGHAEQAMPVDPPTSSVIKIYKPEDLVHALDVGWPHRSDVYIHDEPTVKKHERVRPLQYDESSNLH